eukprot:406025-Pelagomonas_calceolata.AAC.4
MKSPRFLADGKKITSGNYNLAAGGWGSGRSAGMCSLAEDQGTDAVAAHACLLAVLYACCAYWRACSQMVSLRPAGHQTPRSNGFVACKDALITNAAMEDGFVACDGGWRMAL